jgi:spore maturation protein CgeB
MLIDYKEDVRDEIGALAERFMYRDAQDLNDKIGYYLSHPQERMEVVEEVQSIVRVRLKWEDFFARVCADMTAELQGERAAASPM